MWLISCFLFKLCGVNASRSLKRFLLPLLICSYSLVISAEEQSQQRLQAEEAEQQYQTLVHKLNITTKRSQRRE